MKNILFSLGILGMVLLIPGCLHQSDEEVISNAHSTYESLATRYEELLNAPDDDSIIDFGMEFGNSNKLSSWSLSGSWNNALGNDYLTEMDGAPLSRTAFFIEHDRASIDRHMGQLESRSLTSYPIYGKLRKMRTNLTYALHAIKKSKLCTKETQFIESRKLQLRQLAETRRNNELLRNGANRQPVVVTQEETVTYAPIKHTIKPQKAERVVVEETYEVKKPKHKKKKIQETAVIDVDDVPDNSHLVI